MGWYESSLPGGAEFLGVGSGEVEFLRFNVGGFESSRRENGGVDSPRLNSGGQGRGGLEFPRDSILGDSSDGIKSGDA